MDKTSTLQFLSKQCKNKEHIACCGLWEGLGFEIICSCKCHVSKKGVVLDEAPQSAANTLFQNVCHNTAKHRDNTPR